VEKNATSWDISWGYLMVVQYDDDDDDMMGSFPTT
jgi:hypothetical protein